MMHIHMRVTCGMASFLVTDNDKNITCFVIHPTQYSAPPLVYLSNEEALLQGGSSGVLDEISCDGTLEILACLIKKNRDKRWDYPFLPRKNVNARNLRSIASTSPTETWRR